MGFDEYVELARAVGVLLLIFVNLGMLLYTARHLYGWLFGPAWAEARHELLVWRSLALIGLFYSIARSLGPMGA